MINTYYHFISFGRQGLAAAIDTDPDPDKKQKRASIEVLLNVDRKSKPTGEWDKTNSIQRSFQLYGPGDVVGLDERIVVRTDPKPDSGNFEPNYFPLIEFADFDFPWRYSPEPANDDKGLTPWIVLIALIAEGQEKEYEQVARGSDQLPVIKVFDKENLPDLGNAWRWAHVQATSGQVSLSEGQLVDIYEDQPECLVSRLLCPRRLQPKTLYTAFIVPAFKLGWAAGLGDKIALSSVIESIANDLAWKNEDQAGESIELPYYYRWDFRTSLRGDFEHLVRLLEPRELKGLGLRKMDCQYPGFGLCVQCSDPENEGENHILDLEGALQSYDTRYTPWGKDKNGPLNSLEPEEYPNPEEFQERLAVEVLNKANPGSLIRSCIVNPDVAAAQGPEVTNKSDTKTSSSASREESIAEEVLKSISFNALPDGKSVRVSWQTPIMTTGRISYGVEKSSGRVTYDHICSSDTCARQHSVIVQLVPEKIYWLQLRIINREMDIDFNALTASICIPLPAVVPPIYGRWHAACSNVDPDKYTNDWLNVINLDPRHRATAGLGAEVVRKQQEALMSSAWDQIGDIEKGNDILRRAQLGRESGIFLHDRLGSMALEDYLRVTAPVQKRIIHDQDGGSKQTIRTELEKNTLIKSIIRDQDGGSKQTIRTELVKNTLIPSAALDPAFRRISRARGPIGKRQKQRRMDLLRRMATGELQPAGGPPKILGTKTPCDITKDMILSVKPSISLNVDDYIKFGGFKENKPTFIFTLSWESKKAFGQLFASGDWNGDKPLRGEAKLDLEKTPELITSTDGYPVDPSHTGTQGGVQGPFKFTFSLTGESFAYKQTISIDVTIDDYTNLENKNISEPKIEIEPKDIAIDESALRFCDERITFDQIEDALDAGVEGVTIEDDLQNAIRDAFSNFLIPEVKTDRPPTRKQPYFENLRDTIHDAIDPRKTIVERVKKRLKLNVGLAKRFEGDAKGDPLEEIMTYPVFPQPMYEPLKELSESHILPGVEKVPQNTVSVLETNRRFIESYMVGLNHEFSAELLWRGFPTDQRGSYFRQFWDVWEHIPVGTARRGADHIEVPEHLKDIRPLIEWNKSQLGKNDTQSIGDDANSSENVNRAVLVIRGDLLKRYPNTVIYAVNARLEFNQEGKWTGNFIPDLDEYKLPPSPAGGSASTITTRAGDIRDVKEMERETTIAERSEGTSILDLEALPPDPRPAKPVKPTFNGALGTDLVYFGFPFSVEEAKSSSETTGKFFVFEERVTETRFGLDMGGDEQEAGWDNLSWEDFQMADKPGQYLDSSPVNNITRKSGEDGEDEIWDDDASAAFRARVTMQKPVRLAIHADQMIPEPAEQ